MNDDEAVEAFARQLDKATADDFRSPTSGRIEDRFVAYVATMTDVSWARMREAQVEANDVNNSAMNSVIDAAMSSGRFDRMHAAQCAATRATPWCVNSYAGRAAAALVVRGLISDAEFTTLLAGFVIPEMAAYVTANLRGGNQ